MAISFRALKRPAAVLASATLLAAMAAAPARALDDGQQSIFSAIFGMVGLDSGKTDEQIDYRERPPLVLPPKMQLRQPQQAASDRNPAWPLDPDLVKRQRAADAARGSSVMPAKDEDRLTKQQLAARRASAFERKPHDSCDDNDRTPSCIYVPWDKLSASKKAAKDVIVAGQEPERGSLTEPPKGYRVGSKNVKATTEAPVKDNDSPLAYLLGKKNTDE